MLKYFPDLGSNKRGQITNFCTLLENINFKWMFINSDCSSLPNVCYSHMFVTPECRESLSFVECFPWRGKSRLVPVLFKINSSHVALFKYLKISCNLTNVPIKNIDKFWCDCEINVKISTCQVNKARFQTQISCGKLKEWFYFVRNKLPHYTDITFILENSVF